MAVFGCCTFVAVGVARTLTQTTLLTHKTFIYYQKQKSEFYAQ